jgi:hypothetical protein
VTQDDVERRVLARARSQLSLSAADRARHEARLLAAVMPAHAPPLVERAAPPAASNPGLHAVQSSIAKSSIAKWVVVAVVGGGAVGVGVTHGVLAMRDAPRASEVGIVAPTVSSLREVEPQSASNSARDVTLMLHPPASEVRSQPTAPRAESRFSVTRPPGASREEVHRSTAPARPEVDPLNEISMLQGARRALIRDDAAAALDILAELDERFSSGALLEERAAVRVLALCAAGDVGAALQARGAFLEQHPTSIYAPRVRASCAGARLPGRVTGAAASEH